MTQPDDLHRRLRQFDARAAELVAEPAPDEAARRAKRDKAEALVRADLDVIL